MTRYSYGNKQYIAVEGKGKAIALMAALLEANPDDQVLIQSDDCDVYIVSWASRYPDFSGECFVWMSEDEYETYREWRVENNE